MKKLFKTFSIIMSFCCVVCAALQPAAVSAAQLSDVSTVGNIISQETTETEDGGRVVITVKDTTKISNSSASTMATTHTKSASKVFSYYNANNVLCWTFTLNATFKYDKTALVVCTDVSSSAAIYKANWSLVSKTHSKKANQATGKGVFNLSPSNVHYNGPLTITCNILGDIS